MAGFNIFIEQLRLTGIGAPTEAVTLVHIRDGEVQASAGIIHPFGVVPIPASGDPGTLLEWAAVTLVSSDISGYKRLDPDTTGVLLFPVSGNLPDVGPHPEEVEIEQYATEAGQMDGVSCNGSIVTQNISAYKDAAGSSNVAKVKIRLYHRSTGGTETLIGTATTSAISTTPTTYNVDVTITKSWGANERLVAKYFGINEGVPP